MLSKVTTGFQVTIPASFRRKTNIKIGDYVDMRERDNGLVLHLITINKNTDLTNKFNAIFDDEIANNSFKNLSEKQVMNLVTKEIKSARKIKNTPKNKK